MVAVRNKNGCWNERERLQLGTRMLQLGARKVAERNKKTVAVGNKKGRWKEQTIRLLLGTR
jgi:hypothetical protein